MNIFMCAFCTSFSTISSKQLFEILSPIIKSDSNKNQLERFQNKANIATKDSIIALTKEINEHSRKIILYHNLSLAVIKDQDWVVNCISNGSCGGSKKSLIKFYKALRSCRFCYETISKPRREFESSILHINLVIRNYSINDSSI